MPRPGDSVRRRPRRILGLVLLVASVVVGLAFWQPAPGVSWQYQLDGKPDLSVRADVYDIDGFESSARTVAAIHARGGKAVCYFSAGTWESWRPDARRYPREVIGRPLPDWPGERSVDVRRLDLLGPILKARMRMCRDKGFDAVEPDNVDPSGRATGFDSTANERLRFARWVARTAHALGLAVGLKNSPASAARLVDDFDFAVVEECFEYRECERYAPFVRAGKAVLAVEYALPGTGFCAQARQLGFSAIRKRVELGAWRRLC
jgi:hypothetical protein